MSFQIKCAQVRETCLKSGYMEGTTVPVRNYQPNWAAVAKSFGVNTFRLDQGGEGDPFGTDMTTNPEWATHLESLLSLVASAGFKCFFQSLGNSAYKGELGIVTPDGGSSPDGYYIPLPISEAKTMIDKLAGNNSLGHNFITDPRIPVWSISNEAIMGNVDGYPSAGGRLTSTTPAYDWTIQMCDYIRSKGGRTVVPSPRIVTPDGNSWNQDFKITVPMFQGHVDYFERHWYGLAELTVYCQPSQGVYDWNLWRQNYCKPLLQECKDYAPSVDQIFLGEFGLWRGGPASDVGIANVSFTDADRQNFYANYFQAINEVGLRNLNFMTLFDEYLEEYPTRPKYGMVSAPANFVNGKEVIYPASEIIQANYVSPIPFWLPFTLIGIGAAVYMAVMR